MSHSDTFTDTGATTAYYQGVEAERGRIVKLAENRICFDHNKGCDHAACYALSHIIELIRGEQK